jgi:hypothetical protein
MKSPKKNAGQRRPGIRAAEMKRRELKKLFERFRSAADAEEARQLGAKLGQMVLVEW